VRQEGVKEIRIRGQQTNAKRATKPAHTGFSSKPFSNQIDSQVRQVLLPAQHNEATSCIVKRSPQCQAAAMPLTSITCNGALTLSLKEELARAVTEIFGRVLRVCASVLSL
jgi:hypothetical protein